MRNLAIPGKLLVNVPVSGIRVQVPHVHLAAGMLACLLLLRDDDDGSGRGGGAREGVWTREGSKTCVADHKAKGGAAEGQGVVVVVVVVVVVPLVLRCCAGAAEAQDDHPAWRLEGGSQVVLFVFLALLGTGATAASGSSHSPPPMAGRRPTLSIDDGPECV